MNQNKVSVPANRIRNKTVFDVQHGKVPPHNKEAEIAVLSQLLIGSKLIDEVIEILPNQNWFYIHQHQLVYEAILSAHQKGYTIDSVVVVSEMRVLGNLNDPGEVHEVMQLTNDFAFQRALLTHANEIAEHFKRREAIRVSGELMARSFDLTEEIDESIHDSEKSLVDILSVGDVSHATLVRDCIIEFNEYLNEAMNNDHELTGVDTGFGYLNQLTGGWQNTDLIILAARPSVGKTAFAIELAKNAAMSAGKVPSAIFSLEMPKRRLMNRLVSNISMIELDKIQKGNLSDIEFKHVQQTLNQIAGLPLYIDDTFHLSINQLKARAKRLKRENNIGLIVVDYLQLMAGDKSKGNREQEIASISRGLKGIAMELEIPVIALSQMSRDIDKVGNNKREPMLSDLRESGAIEQDADMVMFIYHDTDPDSGEIKNIVKIAKHRNGSLGKMDQCKFFPAIQKWMNPHDADAYMGKTEFKPFAGMQTNPDARIEGKRILKTFDDTTTPF